MFHHPKVILCLHYNSLRLTKLDTSKRSVLYKAILCQNRKNSLLSVVTQCTIFTLDSVTDYPPYIHCRSKLFQVNVQDF